MRLFAIAVVLCATVSTAFAGEFRGGTIGWQVRDLSAPRTVEFTVTTYWDEPAMGRTDVDVHFGDGSTSGPLSSSIVYAGTTRASREAFTVRQARTVHTYASNGPYSASVTGCCRHPTANAHATDSYRLRARIALGTGSYGNPVLMMVDAQLVAGDSYDEASRWIPEATWWGSHIPGGRVASLSESGVSAPAGIEYETNVYGGYVQWNDLASQQPGPSYTVSVVREDLGGSTAMLEFIFDTIPYELLRPTCIMESDPAGAQPGETVTRDFTVPWPPPELHLLATETASIFPLEDDGDPFTSARWRLSWTPDAEEAGRYGLAYVTAGRGSRTNGCWVGLHVPLSADVCEQAMDPCGEFSTCVNTRDGFVCGCDPGYRLKESGLSCEAYCYVMPAPCGSEHGMPVAFQCCTDPSAEDGITCFCPITPDPPPASDGGCAITNGARGTIALLLAVAGYFVFAGRAARRRRRPAAVTAPPQST
jgi:hypothetical protein